MFGVILYAALFGALFTAVFLLCAFVSKAPDQLASDWMLGYFVDTITTFEWFMFATWISYGLLVWVVCRPGSLPHRAVPTALLQLWEIAHGVENPWAKKILVSFLHWADKGFLRKENVVPLLILHFLLLVFGELHLDFPFGGSETKNP